MLSSFSRTIRPAPEELQKLRWLSPAEQRILDLFDTKLTREWEIYVRPHMNGVRPDFVLLHERDGIAVFKVSANKNPSETAVKAEQAIAAQWKDDILKLYCPRLGAAAKYGNITSWVAVTAGVIFPNAEAQNIPEDKYRPISFKEDIESRHIAKIFPYHTIPNGYHRFMTPEFAADLRGWLVLPDFASENIEPLNYKMLDSKQRELMNRDRTASGYRRIRGAAGSGKSLILAIRAARLASEGKKVLIATYNITLWHYLRNLIIRALESEFEYTHFNNWGELSVSDPDKNPLGNITFTHFHYWCKSVCLAAGQEDNYRSLFREFPKKQVLDSELPKLALTLMAHPQLKAEYDAVLLDEGQDYRPLWWQALRQDLKPGGEAMLVADRTQDIYGNGAAWTEETMTGAGFIGRWNEINTGYRMPENLRRLAEIFAETYIGNSEKILPEAKPNPQGRLTIANNILRWTQTGDRERALHFCLKETDYLLQQTGLKIKFANADIIICVDTVRFGIDLCNALRRKGIEVFDTFYDSHDADEQAQNQESKAKKMAFCLEGKTLPSYQNPARVKEGKAAVKITTIHSFKGYETPIMLLCLEKSDPELFYVAFTRIKERKDGSIFSIVCTDPKYKSFGEQFPQHGGDFFDKTAHEPAILMHRLR